MRKNLLLTLMVSALASGGAFAGTLNPATTVYRPISPDQFCFGCVINGVTTPENVSVMILQYEEEVSFVTGASIQYEIVHNGESKTVTQGSNNDLFLGYNDTANYYDGFPSVSEYLGLKINTYVFSNNPEAGEFTVKVPAGIVQNASGDTNPAQEFTFTIVNNSALWSFTADSNPAGNQPWMEYSPQDLSTVTISWDDTTLSLTDEAVVMAYKITGLVFEESQGELSFKELTPNIVNGKLVVDMSSLSSGLWSLGVASGSLTDGTNFNQSLCFQYNIVAPDPITSWQILSPTNTGNLSMLKRILISFDNSVVNIVDGKASEITLTKGSQNYNISVSPIQGFDENYLQIEVSEDYGDDGLTESGVYTLTIPAGVIENTAGGTNVEIVQTFTIVGFLNQYICNPTSGTVAPSNLSTIAFEFPGATSIEYIGPAAGQSVIGVASVGRDGSSATETETTLANGSNMNIKGTDQIEVNMGNVSNSNQYRVSIAARNYRITMEDGSVYYNGALEGLWLAWDGLDTPTILEGPSEEGELVPVSTQIVLTWDYQQIYLTNSPVVRLLWDTESNQKTIPTTDIQLTSVVNPATNQTVENNALVIDLEPTLSEITDINQYELTLTLYAGSVENTSLQQNAPFKIYSFYASPVTEVVPVVAESTSVASQYEITWADATSITANMDVYPTLAVVNVSGETVATLSYAAYSGTANTYSVAQPNMLVCNLPTNLPEAAYYVNLPVGIVNLSFGDTDETEYFNQAISLQLTEDPNTVGIDSFGGDSKNEVIYNLNGLRVDRNKLTKGIYIVNGKKIMVK